MRWIGPVAAVLVAATFVAHPLVIGVGMGAGASAEAAFWKKGKMGKRKGKGPYCFNRCLAKGKHPKFCDKRCG